MAWDVEFTDEFDGWFRGLDMDEQVSVALIVELLEERGVALGHPYTSDVRGSKHGSLRELRIQHQGRPFRVLYAFDPRRVAILLIGGDKTGNKRWYDEFVPVAERLYDEHLRALEREGLP